MEWEGGKSDRYALVTICFRDGDMEHYDEVIFSKDTFVNKDHIELMGMMYGGVSDEPVDFQSKGGDPFEEYWRDGMQAVSIYRVRYLTKQEAETLKKFDVAVDLGAESWQGVSLAGGVDEIEEMLKRKAEFEALPYGNLYGACLLPDGSCMETSLDTCNLMGGRFQGPGTSCNPDDNYLRPRVMRSETINQQGKGLSDVALAIIVGVATGVATTIFGNVLSEMWLDRLREDPELHTTPDELDPQ